MLEKKGFEEVKCFLFCLTRTLWGLEQEKETSFYEVEQLSWAGFFSPFFFFCHSSNNKKKQRFFFFGKKKVPVNERLGSFPKLHWSLFYVLFEVSLNVCSRQAFFLSSCWRKPRSFEIVQKRVPNFLNRDTPNLWGSYWEVKQISKKPCSF